MFMESVEARQAKALRAAANDLRDEAKVVLDAGNLWEDQGGNALFNLPSPYGECGSRGCVCGWMMFEWEQQGLNAGSSVATPYLLRAAVGDLVAEAFGARELGFEDYDSSDWVAVVTRALRINGPEWCADRLDAVAAEVESRALVHA